MSGAEEGRNDDVLRRELERLAAIRSTARPGVFVRHRGTPPDAKGTKAPEKRLEDNWRSARFLWRAARQAGRFGIEALDQDNRHMAEVYLRQAQSAEREAYQRRLGAAGLANLSGTAKPRGRKAGSGSPTIAARNRWLAEAVAAQLALGITDEATAILAALADPAADPEMKAAFKDVLQAGLAKALKAGRKSADKKSKTDF